MYKFQILIYTTAVIKIKYAYISIDMQINTIKSLKMNSKMYDQFILKKVSKGNSVKERRIFQINPVATTHKIMNLDPYLTLYVKKLKQVTDLSFGD